MRGKRSTAAAAAASTRENRKRRKGGDAREKGRETERRSRARGRTGGRGRGKGSAGRALSPSPLRSPCVHRSIMRSGEGCTGRTSRRNKGCRRFWSGVYYSPSSLVPDPRSFPPAIPYARDRWRRAMPILARFARNIDTPPRSAGRRAAIRTKSIRRLKLIAYRPR